MAKLTVLAAVLVTALLALAEASSYTVITTVEEESQGSRQGEQSQQCRQEMQQYKQQLQHCEQFLSAGRQFARAVINQQGEQIQHFMQCCQALRNFKDQDCRCESLSEVVRQHGGSSSRGQSTEQMATKARFLPLFCYLGHTCDISETSM